MDLRISPQAYITNCVIYYNFALKFSKKNNLILHPTPFEVQFSICTPRELQTKIVSLTRMKLAQRVKEEKNLKELTSRQLAKKAVVGYGVISKIENCQPVAFDSVIKVLYALGITIRF